MIRTKVFMMTNSDWWAVGEAEAPGGDNNPQQFEVSYHQIFTPVTALLSRNINTKICQDFSDKIFQQRIKISMFKL